MIGRLDIDGFRLGAWQRSSILRITTVSVSTYSEERVVKFDQKDVRIDVTKGKGPGGQHKNKTSTTVRATHVPTGITVVIDGRSQAQNKKAALRELQNRVYAKEQLEKAAEKKARRDEKIHKRDIIRTYDYRSGLVRDHRTGKSAPLKQVMDKGMVQLLFPPAAAKTYEDQRG